MSFSKHLCLNIALLSWDFLRIILLLTYFTYLLTSFCQIQAWCT